MRVSLEPTLNIRMTMSGITEAVQFSRILTVQTKQLGKSLFRDDLNICSPLCSKEPTQTLMSSESFKVSNRTLEPILQWKVMDIELASILIRALRRLCGKTFELVHIHVQCTRRAEMSTIACLASWVTAMEWSRSILRGK